MKNTIKDVAKKAGVSVGTASMAINGKPGPKEVTRRRVLEAAAELNYIPDLSARTLIKRRSGTVGLVVTDITNPFFGMLAGELNSAVIKRGYALSVCVSGDVADEEARSVKRLIEQRAEGVVIVPSARYEAELPEYLETLDASGVPYVFCTTAYAGAKGACVMCDLEKGSRMMTGHLLETGHRRIALLTGAKNTLFSSERINGCVKAHGERGLAFDGGMVFRAYPDFGGGYAAAGAALLKKPDAIMTVNDQMAMGVIKRLKEQGLAAGRDISVTGFDDTLYASLLETPLTTVRQPVSELAERTAEVLFRSIKSGKSTSGLYLVKPVLKIRSSTKKQ